MSIENCRVCGSENIIHKGQYRPYLDYSCEIYDCRECSCRFTAYNADVYEKLHASRTSSYAQHEKVAREVHNAFHSGNINRLRTVLGRTLKFQFVMDMLDVTPKNCNILEVGCSRGYLTSYAIAKDKNILGVDVSSTAVQGAKDLFGDYFVLPDDPRIKELAPFDAIYHVGTIGCVEYPIAMTNNLLSMLKPGGLLFFNAPNVAACSIFNTIWVTGTSPPDLVTLFPAHFWKDQFNEFAEVEIRQEKMKVRPTIQHFIKKFFKRELLPQGEKMLFQEQSEKRLAYSKKSTFFQKIRQSYRLSINNSILLQKTLPLYPDEFGLYVIMTKK